MFTFILIVVACSVACLIAYFLIAGTIVFIGDYRFSKAVEQAEKAAVLAKEKAASHAIWLANYEEENRKRAQHKEVMARFSTVMEMVGVACNIITGHEADLTEEELAVKAQFEWNMANPLTIR